MNALVESKCICRHWRLGKLWEFRRLAFAFLLVSYRLNLKSPFKYNSYNIMSAPSAYIYYKISCHFYAFSIYLSTSSCIFQWYFWYYCHCGLNCLLILGTNESVTLNAYDTGTAGAMRKFVLCTVGNCIPVTVLLVRPPTVKKKWYPALEVRSSCPVIISFGGCAFSEQSSWSHYTTLYYTKNDIYM